MVRKDGFMSFYKGMSVALVGTVASFGGYFFFYRMLKNIVLHSFKMKESQLTSKQIMLISALAGSTSSVLANPFWFLNTRMTLAQNDTKLSFVQTAKEVYENEGIGAFYKGVLPNMILVLNPIINFVVYEALKNFLTKNDKDKTGALKIFIASSVGKLLATFATYPILTLRVKL